MQFEDLKRIQIEAGSGVDAFPMNHGSFAYRERVKWREKLSLDCIEEREDRVMFALKDAKGEKAGTLRIQKKGSRFSIRFQVNRAGVNRYWLSLPVNRHEHFYGCGEIFSQFDLKGEKVRIWVAEHQNSRRISRKLIVEKLRGKRPGRVQGLRCYESYYAQPTFVSSGHYYVHVDGTSFMEFDFSGKETVTLCLRKKAEVTVGLADTYGELSELLSAQLGRQHRLPGWLYDGVILGIQTGCETVEQKLAQAEKYHIPVTGVWCQDWCGCRKTTFGYQVMWNWTADGNLYPELKDRIFRWRSRGVRFLGYINPFLAIERELYCYATEHGYCVKNKDGGDYLVTITTFPAAMIDLTNPAACEWYKEIIKSQMIDLGMAGWMADFGEYLPTDCVLFSGENPKLVHNTWPARWAKLNREAIQESGRADEVFFFTRAGFTDTLLYSDMMWNGDQHVDWSLDDGIASVIPATLSLAMSGYGIAHSDIGGYTTVMQMTRGKELLMRWEEMNAFSPLMRFHEGNQPARNVQYDADEELLTHLSRMASLHVGLKGYLQECEAQNAASGTPVMRPLFYHYEEEAAYSEKYEYLLGRDLLVAPVIREGDRERGCYLPEDRWIHLFTGKHYRGGRYRIPAPIGMPPVFVREDSGWREQVLKLAQKAQGGDK